MCPLKNRVRLRFWSGSVLLFVLACSPTRASVGEDSCWNSDPACTIRATLHQLNEAPHSAGLSVDINCQPMENEVPLATPLLRPLKRAHNLVLNGCHTPLSAPTYGLEFLSNCDSVVQVTVESFHSDSLQPFNCSNSSNLQIEVLHYKRNEMAAVGVSAFEHLPKLRELYFFGNALRHVEQHAFDALRSVERIYIENEPLLALKYADLFERTSVAELHLVRLLGITPQLFGHLPETVREISVRHSRFGDGDAITVTNPQELRNLSVVDCALKTFTLIEASQSPTVQHINLSGNTLADFRIKHEAEEGNSSVTALETLDLSANKLETLPWQWLHGLSNLRHLVLRDNLLKSLSLPQLLVAVPAAALIDLRNNRLVSLQQATAANIEHTHVRLQIDRNPWNCLWLLNFAHTHPEKFRIFQYEKFISQINVNGLACEPSEVTVAESEERLSVKPENLHTQGHHIGNDTTSHIPGNISTYTLVYGDPWEQKRNHRTSGLILVFMLPLGIAILSALLYLWIYCQKVFHLSYYRSMPWMRHGASSNRFRSAERFDVVRQLPPTTTTSAASTALANNNEGYEPPLNGLTSICNCNSVPSPYANEKCRKAHHITYETLPSEQPYKIYEEIIGGDDDGYGEVLETNLSADGSSSTHPLYDHLTYAEPLNAEESGNYKPVVAD